jgi:hypothetical protein
MGAWNLLYHRIESVPRRRLSRHKKAKEAMLVPSAGR